MATPLTKVKNFGPMTPAEFEVMGLKTLEQVIELGFEDTCRRCVLYYPERLNDDSFIGVICAIENTLKTKATERQKTMAHDLVKLMKYELGVE